MNMNVICSKLLYFRSTGTLFVYGAIRVGSVTAGVRKILDCAEAFQGSFNFQYPKIRILLKVVTLIRLFNTVTSLV